MEKLTKHLENIIKKNWDKPALTDYQIATQTYGQLANKIAALHALWREAGLQLNDKIAINARSTSHWAEIFMGSLTGGYVSVQLYNAFLPADVQQLTNHSDSKILYTEKKSFQGMDFEAMPALIAAIDMDTHELLASRGNFAEAYANYLQTLASGAEITADHVTFHHRDWDDVCTIMYTSGSTGNPKGVMLTVRNISRNVEVLQDLLPFCEGGSYMSVLPYAHIFGLVVEMITPLCTGMHLVILGRMPIPSVLEEMMREYKPKMFLAVPLILAKFAEYVIAGEQPSEALREKVLAAMGGHVEVFATGGAAIPPAIEQLLAFQINMPFITGYGMTECAPLISLGKVGKYKAKSCGEVIDTVEVRIDSTDPKNIPGEVQVKGDCVFAGYYKNEQATADSFTEDGWFRTGDMGTIDEDRTLFLVGRCKSMLLSSNGQNIYPEEIEVVLNALPYVAESVVVQRDQILHALIVPNMAKADNDNIDAQALQAIMEGNIKSLNTQIPQYAFVSSFELRYEPFAKTPKGSIRRFMYC